MRIFNVFLLLAGLMALTGGSSCNLINPEEVVPTYVHIDSFAFSKDPGNRYGSSSYKVTNVYVYFNNAPVGIFDLPATFPVMATSPGELTVVPGIDFTGLRGYEVMYPLYTSHKLALGPAPGQTVDYTPVTGYVEDADLLVENDFEDGLGAENGFVKVSGDTTIINVTRPSEVYEGSGSGALFLGAGKDSATIISSRGQYIRPNIPAYIELDYRGNMPLQVGMMAYRMDGSTNGITFITLRPRTDWGKIYIGVREFVSANQGPEYKLLFRVQRPAEVTDGFLYLDNVKVMSL